MRFLWQILAFAHFWIEICRGCAITPIENNLITHTPSLCADEVNPDYWLAKARSSVRERLKPPATNKAKNVIFFIGDGMSLSTQMAARIHKGQLRGNPGEEEELSFEKFPTAGLVKTYCNDLQTPDSSCTSTAYCCGVKVNGFTLGVSPRVLRRNCTASMDPANHLTSIAEWAQRKGLSTGFVTTTTLTHASPSGLYGHVADRFWESDTDVAAMGWDPSTCMDLATQLVTQNPGRNFNVMMGGGMNKFLPSDTLDVHGNVGQRSDGKNLVQHWLDANAGSAVVTNREQLLNLQTERIDKVMGLFASSEMAYHVEANSQKQPTLMEMTQVAMDVLKQNPKGYFLFVEGGRIDHGNHANKLQIAVDETLEMDKAVEWAVRHTDERDTLIVVSADHAHPLTLSGEGQRGDNIFSLNPRVTDLDGNPFLLANYAIGRKHYKDDKGKPIDMSDVAGNVSSVYPSLIHKDGHHSDDDVGVFAHGPQSHLFTGVMEQNVLPHLMAYAACIGDGPTVCDNKSPLA